MSPPQVTTLSYQGKDDNVAFDPNPAPDIPCKKFRYALKSDYVITFDDSVWKGDTSDKGQYEGLYKITGESIHQSGNPFPYKIEFWVDIKLNCNEVEIVEPPG